MDRLAEVLDDAERGRWPSGDDDATWQLLANWAFQTECLMIDEAENLEWEAQMRALLHHDLPYAEFVTARMEQLKRRLRARKLAQTNLRYRYGFKPRKASWVQRDVKRFYLRWSSE